MADKGDNPTIVEKTKRDTSIFDPDDVVKFFQSIPNLKMPDLKKLDFSNMGFSGKTSKNPIKKSTSAPNLPEQGQTSVESPRPKERRVHNLLSTYYNVGSEQQLGSLGTDPLNMEGYAFNAETYFNQTLTKTPLKKTFENK